MPKHFFSKLLRPPYSITLIALLTAAFIVIFDNRLFWHNVATKLGVESFLQSSLMLSSGALLILLFTAVFLLTSFRPTFKPFLLCLLLIAATVSYFSDSYGVIIDKSMVHNILETDFQEARELFTWPLLWHLLLYGFLPAALVLLAPIRYPQRFRGLLFRAGMVVACLAIIVSLFVTSYKEFVLFGRANRELQVFINPTYPIYAFQKVLKKKYFAHDDEPLQVIAADAVRNDGPQPTVVILAVGETARAKELGLNGYSRNTTPFTSDLGVINFSDVNSCGTATAESVPCMFSSLDKDNFSRDKASRLENLLDILQRTGVKVVWRDNDSGSKGVADRVTYEDFSKKGDERFCDDSNCYDEVLLDGLGDLIRNNKGDLLVVLHLKGSHGPSYYKRSPSDHKLFLPECTQDNVQDCSQQTIVNAYDNTIVYTDYVLSKVIDLLKAQNSNTAMLYLSDHGESLGENGIYLHGLPYALAPSEQTHIPMLFWASPEFLDSHHLSKASLLAKQHEPLSQDNLFHSLLGLFDVKTAVYQNSLDMFAGKNQVAANGHQKSDQPAKVTSN